MSAMAMAAGAVGIGSGVRFQCSSHRVWSVKGTRKSGVIPIPIPTQKVKAKGMVVVVARVYRSKSAPVDRSSNAILDPAVDIESLRSSSVRLIDKEQNMVGIVSTREAIQMAEEAELQLVILSTDADPPVVRIMDYRKYKYEQHKKKRDQQKKSAASRGGIKELKMGCNIDVHDYDVRLRAAKRFLKDGDKVKIIVQFKGREHNFREKTIRLFERIENDLGKMVLLESKNFADKIMSMMLVPNKGVLDKSEENPRTEQVLNESEEKPSTEQVLNKSEENPITEQVLNLVSEEKPSTEQVPAGV